MIPPFLSKKEKSHNELKNGKILPGFVRKTLT
jgi:hypothetical protein